MLICEHNVKKQYCSNRYCEHKVNKYQCKNAEVVLYVNIIK